MRRTSWLLRALATTLLAAPGCTMVADVDRFEEEERETQVEDPSNPYRSLEFSITGMTSHLNRYFQLNLLDDKGRTQFVAIGDPYESDPDTVYFAPNVVFKTAAASSRLEFFGDMDGDRKYTPFTTDSDGKKVEVDHSWRIEGLDQGDGRVQVGPQTVKVNFSHNYSFVDLAEYSKGTPAAQAPSGGEAIINIANVNDYLNKRFEVRVADIAGNFVRTVGLYRFPLLRHNEVQITLPGIIYETNYEITVYVDQNGNLEYDNPAKEGGDLGWRFTATATPQNENGQRSTLTATFDPTDPAVGPSNVDVGLR